MFYKRLPIRDGRQKFEQDGKPIKWTCDEEIDLGLGIGPRGLLEFAVDVKRI